MGRTVTYAIGFAKSSPFSHEIKQQKAQRKIFLQDGNSHAAATASLDIADLLIAQCDEIDPDLSPENQEEEIESYLLEAFQYCEKARKALTAVQDTASLANHDSDESKFTDFDHARVYYLKERTVLDTLTSDDYDKDGKVLADLIRSNNFNLGVIETKFPDTKQKAEDYLITALKQAKTLTDAENEKKTWWELGNTFKKRGDLDRVLQCQAKELLLIRRHGFNYDEIPCLTERVKTHLELGNYKTCLEICKEIRDIEGVDGEGIGSATMDLVTRTEATVRDITNLPTEIDELTMISRARLYLDLGQMHYDASMTRSALTWAETALEKLGRREDINVELQMLRIDLLQLKANSQWALRDTSLSNLIELNNEILSCIRTYVTDNRDRIDLSRPVYERFIRMYDYYERPAESDRWRQVIVDAEKEYEELNELTDSSTCDEFGDTCDPSVMEHKAKVTASLAFMTVRVNVPLGDREETMLIPCRRSRGTVEWLMEETAKRTWENYGVEPNITFLRVDKASLFPDDLIADVILDANSTISAVVEGYKRKPFSDHYQNICKRMKKPVNQSVVDSLGTNNNGVLSLRTAGDEDIDSILNGIKLPAHVNLSDNRLTAKTLYKICQRHLLGLESLSLAFNPLGANTLEYMVDILKHSNLRLLDLEGSYIGEYSQKEEALQNFNEYDTLVQFSATVRDNWAKITGYKLYYKMCIGHGSTSRLITDEFVAEKSQCLALYLSQRRFEDNLQWSLSYSAY
ncbi:hypothetical protein DFQ28_002791 [Apophysomyces sp. BC1034]|nr:hypothetical protein DFQ29_002065 [Apophysomyces sp. BC1021]KAG0189874.1 hypothetical protein DFQ28_002791 [Apophysomyces sp. BC1034]